MSEAILKDVMTAGKGIFYINKKRSLKQFNLYSFLFCFNQMAEVSDLCNHVQILVLDNSMLSHVELSLRICTDLLANFP